MPSRLPCARGRSTAGRVDGLGATGAPGRLSEPLEHASSTRRAGVHASSRSRRPDPRWRGSRRNVQTDPRRLGRNRSAGSDARRRRLDAAKGSGRGGRSFAAPLHRSRRPDSAGPHRSFPPQRPAAAQRLRSRSRSHLTYQVAARSMALASTPTSACGTDHSIRLARPGAGRTGAEHRRRIVRGLEACKSLGTPARRDARTAAGRRTPAPGGTAAVVAPIRCDPRCNEIAPARHALRRRVASSSGAPRGLAGDRPYFCRRATRACC